jgi:hypothetical protein
VIAYAPAWAVWLALGLWGVALVLGAVAFVMARRLYRQLRPMVEPYLQMFAGPAMVDAAAGTGSESPGSSPAAVLDQCEYGDHEWSPRTSTYGDGVTTHYCLRCGFTEHAPGS